MEYLYNLFGKIKNIFISFQPSNQATPYIIFRHHDMITLVGCLSESIEVLPRYQTELNECSADYCHLVVDEVIKLSGSNKLNALKNLRHILTDDNKNQFDLYLIKRNIVL